MDSVRIDKDKLVLKNQSLKITTVTNINLVFERETVIPLSYKSVRKPDGSLVERGLVTQTGRVEPNESARHALVRETDEESGINIDASEPVLFGYRTYDNDPSSSHVYFLSIHLKAPPMKQVGQDMGEEVLTPPKLIPVKSFLDTMREKWQEYRCPIAHRMPIAGAICSLERLGMGARGLEVAFAIPELVPLAREAMERYEYVASQKMRYLLITPAREVSA